MLGILEQSNRKGLIRFDHDWQLLSRDDIYRQRVFGTESGASDFIPINDTRRLTVLSTIIYILFIAVATNYTWGRITIYENYVVQEAITESLLGKISDVNPEPKYWADMESVDDLKVWLLNAFPHFLTPQVQGFNFPIDAVRFTLRRVQEVDNTEKRFSGFAPRTWTNKNGIQADTESDVRDDQADFGAYRRWDASGLRPNAVDQWSSAKGWTCDGGELLDTVEESTSDKALVVRNCNNWCSDLIADSKPCRCWTLTGRFVCKFYYIPLDKLQSGDETPLRNSRFPNVVYPPVIDSNVGGDLNYPLMERFIYQKSGGYRNTAGHVTLLYLKTQEKLVQDAQLLGVEPLKQSRVISRQIHDWIEGGWLSRGASTLTIDFVTYNPNMEVFAWTALTFEVTSAGCLQKDYNIESLRITQAEREQKEVSMGNDLSFPNDFVYIILVIVYVLTELWEFGQRGMKYLTMGWNLLTILSLLLHVSMLLSRHTYLTDSDFTKNLIDLTKGQLSTEVNWTTDFQTQMLAFDQFLLFASVNLVFVWMQLVHYLSDIVPRVGVLVDSMYRSVTPIIFLFVIVLVIALGFVTWANLMFGKSNAAFSTVADSVMSCVELLFGQIEAYLELRDSYPISGMVFFISFFFIFFILQNLSKAIILVSYTDANAGYKAERLQHASRRRAVASEGGHDFLFKHWNVVKHKVDHLWAKGKENPSGDPSGALVSTYQFSRGSTALFGFYILLYIWMVYFQVEVYWAGTLTSSVFQAVESPTFSTMNELSGQVVHTNNFSSIQTRDDVVAFLTQVLPKTMYNTSQGRFGNAENPLKTYHSALPTVYPQLVINNWNIIVARDKPVRITTRLAKMVEVGSRSVGTTGSLVSPNSMRRSSPSTFSIDGLDADYAFDEATQLDEIINSNTRDVIKRRCQRPNAETVFTYGAMGLPSDERGWSCMLDVDAAKTMEILEDLASNNFITSQTTILTVDFVVYNGWANSFVYVAITFVFQPDGRVTKDVTTFAVRLGMFSAGNVPRVLLEVVVFVLTVIYLILSLRDAREAVLVTTRGWKDTEKPSPAQRAFSISHAVVNHFTLQPFNIFDLTSSIMTIVTFGLWYAVVFLDLRSLFFPERPVWDQSTAAQSEWASDSAVIFEFFRAGRSLRWFIRICAVNAVIMFFRALKYFQVFPRMRMMFRIPRRGLSDIVWFIIMMFVILMGFATAGHQLFGTKLRRFNSMINSVVSCFEMVLGTYKYSEMRASASLVYVLPFMFTYMFLFKYMLINMFFAIMDDNFREEHEEQERDDKTLREARKKNPHLKAGVGVKEANPFVLAMNYFKQLRGRGSGASREVALPADALAQNSDQDQTGGDQSMISHDHSAMGFSSPELTHETSRVSSDSEQPLALSIVEPSEPSRPDVLDVDDIIHKDVVTKAKNWQCLPPEIQTWALDTSKRIFTFIENHHRKRAEIDGVKQYELDRIMTEAESEIKKERSKKGKKASEMKKDLEISELKRLKHIHQDQESLAWYIMKREAELKKLEQMKTVKQERFDKMVQAAKSLINTEDDPGALGAITNGR